MSRKMIFMLLSQVWGLTYEMKRNFEHLVQEIRPRTCGRMVFKLRKNKQSLRDLSWCDGIICGGCGKKLRRFCTFCHVWCLQIEASQRKNHTVEMDSIRFGVKVTVKLWSNYKTFCIGHREHRLFHVKFWYFFETVW
jgi:hypothetical protein